MLAEDSLPMRVVPERLTCISDTGVTSKAEVHEDRGDSHAGEFPHERDSVRQMVVLVAIDTNPGQNGLQGESCFSDCRSDLRVVSSLAADGSFSGRFGASLSSGTLALASTRMKPGRPSTSQLSAMSQFGVFAPFACLSHQDRSVGHAECPGIALGPNFSRRASAGNV